MPETLTRPIVTATLVAGTLDLISAFVFAGMAGIGVLPVLRYVASGPFGDAAQEGGTGWAAIGLAVHFAIMAAMAAAWMVAARRLPVLTRRPVIAGLAYGVLLWVIMYYVVKGLRWPGVPLPHEAANPLWSIGNQLFSHCILVGLPIALIAARRPARRPFG